MPRSLQESKLANLDLNLLVSLDALLQERSVSRAAERLGLPMARAATPGTDPRFVSMITELVTERRSKQASGFPDFCPNDCCRIPAARTAATPGPGR